MTAKHIKPKAKPLKMNPVETKKTKKTKKQSIKELVEERGFTPWQIKFIEEYFIQKTQRAMGPMVSMVGEDGVRGFARDIATDIAQAAMWEAAKQNILNNLDD